MNIRKQTKAGKPSKAQLQTRIADLEAQLASSCHFMASSLDRAAELNLKGSCVILELRLLGGRQIGLPVAIRDGLSEQTIEALQADIKRSYALAIEFTP